jgi:2-polyprenyl-6-methoxyphenol hydroxylase-like FAD-dependent oxidoreductase
MMLGFLLARSGVDVVLLEKYPDFFRDFRHSSSLDTRGDVRARPDR